GIFLLLAVAVALLFVPAVQKSLAIRAVSGDERKLEAEYLRVGLGKIEARELAVTEADASYRLENLRAEISLLGAIFGGEIRIEELVATGVIVDLSEKEDSDEEDEEKDSDEEVFEGILEALRLPMPVHL